MRLLFGGIKGLIVGGTVGYGAYRLGLTGGFGYVVYGIVGFAVGLFVGRPFWSHLFDKNSTMVTSMLKGAFGFGLGAGFFALAHNVVDLPDVALLGQPTRELSDWPFLFGGGFGFLLGAWFEIDDPPVRAQKKLEPPPIAKTPTN